MAESYRGLTIRIGGDTTKLTQALHTANQAIAGTQSGLKKLSDALKMDPSSFKAAQLQVGAVAEQASNAATRIINLNRAMQQVGDSIPKNSTQTIREMAAGWENVQMKAAQARDFFNGMTQTLAAEYTKLSAVSDEAAKAFGETFSKGWKIDTNIDSVISDIERLPSAFQKSDKELDRFISKFGDIQNKYQSLSEAAEMYQKTINTSGDPKIVETSTKRLDETKQKLEELDVEFQKLVTRFTNFDGEVFKFDNENVSLAALKSGLDDIVASGQRTQEWADEMYTKFESMKIAWLDARDSLNVANTVAQYADLEAETAKAEAKVKSLVNEMVKLAQTSETFKGLGELRKQLDNITASGESAKTRMQEVLKVMSDNNKNGMASGEGVKVSAMQAYADAVAAAEAKVENLYEQLKAYDGADEAVIKLANSTQSLAGATREAESNFEESATALKTFEAAANILKERMDQIKANNPDDWAGSGEYQNLARQFNVMGELIGIAKDRFAEFKKELSNLNEASEIRELRTEVVLAKDEAKGLADINITPKVDISVIDGLSKALSALSDKNFSLDGFTKFRTDVQRAADTLDDAKKRYEELNAAAAKDPTNANTLAMRTQALDEYIVSAKSHIEAMRAEMAAIPSDRVDAAALAAGKAKESYDKAKQEVDKYKTAIVDLNKRIDELTKQKNEIKVVDEDSKKRVDELAASIDDLKQRRAALAAAGDAAFDSLAIADNTRRVQENTVAIQQDEATLRQLQRTSREVADTSATPKVDEAAFMQVIDRIAQAARRMGQEIVQASNEVDSAYRDMRKTVNATDAEFEELKNAAIEFSQTSVTSSDTMLEMQALGGQLGVLSEDLQQFGEIGSNLDIATDLDAEDIALKLGQISNVLQLDIDGMQGFADALVRLGNNMPAQESAIMAVAQRFGAVASTANFSGEEVLAWSAAIAATGQRSEAAATAISNTVSGIEQAIATGGNDLKQFAAIAGMSADEFQESWKQGPTEALKAFINGLQTLNDSDESAVAALENMGITGVRQQQTLLALSRTIDSLDEALVMSSNAWNGVSDQWGQAGDAAIEAEKKSKGFSGTLSILQNNAQNVAASLGDGLIPYMKLASQVLEVVTDVLNNMPTPVKELLVGMGGLSLAFSTLTPMLNVFSKGMTSIFTALAKTNTFGGFVAELTGFADATKAAELAGVEFSGMLSGPMVLGIGAAVAALMWAISAIEEYRQKQETLHEATYGLSHAMESSKAGYDAYIAGAQESTRSISELKDAINETIEAQANLANEISQKWNEIGASEATVDTLIAKIGELSSKSSLTAEEQNELVAAVNTFNGICGTSVDVIDEQTGKLSDSISTIESYADAWKSSTESSQALEDYGEILKQLSADEAELAEVNEKLERVSNSSGDWFVSYEDMASGTAGAIGNLTSEQERLQAAIDNGRAALQNAVSAMSPLESEVSNVEAAFAATGDSLSNYGTFTDAELRRIVDAFNDSSDQSVNAVQRVKNAIDAMQSSAGQAASIAGQLEGLAKDAINTMYNAAKVQYDNEYNALKASLDAQYNAAKASYDAAYKAQQKAYDKQYKAAQKAFDAEYKQAQKAYDKQYKERQKAYQKQYDALKKRLDDEYKRRKEQYDKQLKALKESQQDEVDAFKKATDAKLKDMEREYKQRLKMLELEYNGRTDDIDQRIAALKGETEAEKKAIEERKEQEKVAELETAVTKAKSRRKRAEAEKALNDYLQELNQKRNEEARDAEIERLEAAKDTIKDELEARKEALKEQYDAEVEAYKEDRAAKLEALQEANTEEYETQKAHYDALLQALKDKNDAQLETLKEQQTEQLEALKESQQAQLESMKENQQAQLEAMKESQQASLESMKAGQQAALQNMKNAHNQQLQQLKADQQARLKAIKDGDADVLAEEAIKNDKLIGSAGALGVALGANAKAIADDQHKTFSKMADDQTNDGKRGSEGLRAALANATPGIQTAGDNLANAAESGPAALKDKLAQHGADSGESFDRGLSQVIDTVGRTSESIASSASSPLANLSSESYNWGWDFGNNFNSGIWDTANSIWNAASSIASGIASYLHFSVPDKGPLSDEDKWGGDFVQNLIDGMREREKDLYRQTQKMARIMEDGFDPELSVNAAYEALDTIGKNRSNAMASVIENNSAPNITINLSMNLSGVSMNDNMDIERLAKVMSQEMAAQAARQLAGRL